MEFIKIAIKTLAFSLSFVWLFSCSEEKENEVTTVISQESQVFSLLTAAETGIYFKNTSVESVGRNLAEYDYFYNGSGVAIGDLNNDGLADLFFAGNDAVNKMYVNKGNFNFEDISKTAGIEGNKWATGVTMVDINEDGFLDIYVCYSGPSKDDKSLANELYLNNGDLTFTESALKFGIADAAYSSQATFFDMDKDGDLDLFVMNHSWINFGNGVNDWLSVMDADTEKLQKSTSTLYRNEGNGTFKDITKEAGLYRPGFGLGLAISDFDENGYLDIYVANDYFIPDFLFFNLGDGKFVENIKARASHTSYYSMGCDAADFNNDGLVDLAVVDMTPSDHFRGKTQMERMDVGKFRALTQRNGYIPQYMFNTLSLNRGKGNFSEIALMAGVSQTEWSWAPLFIDLDNNGLKDLVITNGFKRDTKDRDWSSELKNRMATEGASAEVSFDQIKKATSTPVVNYIYENNGNLTFNDASKAWGFNEPSFSQGAAYGDLDNDGDMDMVINNLEKEAFVYRNNTADKKQSNYVQFLLNDTGKPASVMHSKIHLYAGEEQQLVTYDFVRGYMSSMQPIAHFGLGNRRKIDSVVVVWPNNTKSVVLNPAVNQKHELDKTKLTASSNMPGKTKVPFIEIAGRIPTLRYEHKENAFDDYKKEILLPHGQSNLGPALSIGDVNGDTYDDIFIGGAKGQAAELYIQNNQQILTQVSLPIFKTDSKFEDVGSLLFDADGDGDLDLYVCSGGGGDVEGKSGLLQDRLYLNKGNGDFVKTSNRIPAISSSTAAVLANDWDGDGDLDLFVGGRTEPGKYPQVPRSYLLQNNNGVFKDVTKEIAPEIASVGMVTDVTWTDVNNDGKSDLIVVGEWMPIRVFTNTGTGFESSPNVIGESNAVGWWYSVEKGDFDNDGDEDLVVGNLGKNNKFHPKLDKPLHIFSNDFDDNGTLDIVLSKEYKGALAPVRGKECSTDQMPFIKDKFPLFSEFASSSLDEIYGADKLEEALHYEATSFASMYLENMGNGSFVSSQLPSEAQIGPINDMVVYDFNKDGNLDIVIGGNMLNTEVETPAYDGSKGLFMKGNGNGTFNISIRIEDSGIYIPRDVKKLAFIGLLKDKNPAFVVANNNAPLNIYLYRK